MLRINAQVSDELINFVLILFPSGSDVRPNCPSSPSLTPIISELCFPQNFTRDLVVHGEGSWQIFICK